MLDADEIEPVLHEVVRDYKGKLYSVVTEALSSRGLYRELRALHLAFERYYGHETGRWYDPYHVLFSTLFASESAARGDATALAVTATILHDIGYFAVADAAAWSGPESRIVHMWKGAAAGVELLIETREFEPPEICRIAEMIATHDYLYLGRPLPFDDPDSRTVRNADRVWIMHLLSFYKDWASRARRARKRRGEPPALGDLLKARAAWFYGPTHLPSVADSEITDLVREGRERYALEPPMTDLTRSWVDLQFESRNHEIDKAVIVSGLPRFEQYARKHIEKEIANKAPVFGD